MYRDFDFSRASIFQGGINARLWFQSFEPFVLSVEPLEEKYQIRVLYFSSSNLSDYSGSKIWCIHKLNAINENGRWVFENLLVAQSENWLTEEVGIFEYIYPPHHIFNTSNAERATDFCSSLFLPIRKEAI